MDWLRRFPLGMRSFPLTRAEADITDAEAIRAALERIRPDLVVHPAGIPDLDLCEADPANAFRVNVPGHEQRG